MAYWQQEGGLRGQSGRGVGITNNTAAPWWYLVAVWVGSRRPPLYKRYAKRRSVHIQVCSKQCSERVETS